MGRLTNIMTWLARVIGWTFLFAAHIVSANAELPAAIVYRKSVNFSLNPITTASGCSSDFLWLAAVNRSERNLELTLAAG